MSSIFQPGFQGVQIGFKLGVRIGNRDLEFSLGVVDLLDEAAFLSGNLTAFHTRLERRFTSLHVSELGHLLQLAFQPS